MKRLVPALGLLLSACTVGPDYVKPAVETPPDWSEQAPGALESTEHLKDWWKEFDDPLLNRLIDEAATDNLSVKAATERLREVRQQRTIAGSGAYPSVNLDAQAFRARSSTTLDYPPGIGTYTAYSAGIDASWELDIFGGTRRAVEAAEATIGAAEEDRRAILTSLLAEVADDYAALRADQERVRIAEANIESERQSVRLTQTAFARGLGTALEVTQAQAQLETVEAGVPDLKAAIDCEIHALSILTGRLPGELQAELETVGAPLPQPPALPVSLPADVIADRPDVRRAERRLAAANAQIGVAQADLYPKFSIPLQFIPATSALGKLFNAASFGWTFGLSEADTLYNGGKNEARLEAARSVEAQQRLAYRQAVLDALKDVEDAVANVRSDRERRVLLEAAVRDNGKAVSDARRLYAAGLSDFLKVLISERALFQTQDALAQSDLVRTQHLIGLYKALGGGWQ